MKIISICPGVKDLMMGFRDGIQREEQIKEVAYMVVMDDGNIAPAHVDENGIKVVMGARIFKSTTKA